MTESPAGWMFGKSNALPWQPMGDKVAMKMLGAAGGRVVALFKFDAGYNGTTHHHDDAEFSYLLEGDIVSNGVSMEAGDAYAAEPGTDHTEFRTSGGAVLVSVFKAPKQS